MTKKKSVETFINEANTVFSYKYDYSKVEYKDTNSKVCIICPEHGEFLKSPKHHLHGQGCPKCSFSNRSKKKTLTTEEFIKKANKIHGNRYNYTKTKYKSTNHKVCIICPKHGEFWQVPHNHLQGQGCPKCSGRFIGGGDYFVEKARNVHGNKYNYSKIEYVNSSTKVCIICPVHGEFWQKPNDHLQGKGCSCCSHANSNEERKLTEFLRENKINVAIRDRTVIPPYELDIYIPEKKLAIEYDGLIWHSDKFGRNDNYHLNKTELCEEKGIKLIHIFEDEWLFKKDAVKSKIMNYLDIGNSLNSVKEITDITEISQKEAEDFLDKNNIQGFLKSTLYIGGFYKKELVGVMSFSNYDGNKWKITRFTSKDANYSDVEKLMFGYFVEKYNPFEITTLLDRRWFGKEDNPFVKLGFKLDEVLRPDYYLVVGQKRVDKHCQLLEKSKDFPHIYDCGAFKYKWLK